MNNLLSNEVLSTKSHFIESLFKRPLSLSQFLPYDEYIEDEHIFVLKDGSLGALFEIDLAEHEPLTSKKIIEKVNALKTWFSLPENCTLQILYDQSYISPMNKIWDNLEKEYEKSHPVSKLLYQEKLKSFKNPTNLPYERKAYVSIRYYPEESKSNFKLMKQGHSVLHHQAQDFIKNLKHFGSILKEFKENSKIELEFVDAEELASHLRKTFNPKTFYKRDFSPYSDKVSLCDQLIYCAPKLDYKGIEREGVKSRTLSLKTAPQYAYPGGMAYFTGLNFPYKLSINFSFPEKEKIKRFYDFKEFLLDKAPSAKGKRQLKEIRETQDSLAHDDRCLFMTFNVIVEGETDEILDERVRKVASIFNNDLECEIIEEEDIGLGLFFNSLPLNYSPEADLSSARFIRILKSDAIKFIPIFDSFRGLDALNPLQIYKSRENNLINFSLIENETSNHTCVIADSGSGKSAFIIDCIQAAKRMNPEPLVFVIDKKSSYKSLAKYYDADMTIFEAGQDVPFSPFRGVYDEQKITFLTQLMVTAIKLTSPKFDIESEHLACITKALKLAYKKKSEESGLEYVDGELKSISNQDGVELGMDDFIAELASLTSQDEFESMESSIELVINKLRPFFGDGMYAKYFKNSSPKKDGKSPLFYIYDLDALDSDPVLQTIMTMSVIEEIRQTIKLPEHKGRGGFIVLEELGMLGRNNDTASKFIIDAAETFRKLGYWLIALTPRPQNYFDLEAGKAIWGVADNFVFLKMNADNVDYLLKNSTLLDEANAEIIKSLETKKGKYAEVFYMNKNKTKQGAFRYYQTPYDRWLSPTNLEDMAKLEKAFQEVGQDKWKALDKLIQTY